MNLKHRSTESELMDDPNLDKKDLEIALQDISIVNSWLGGNQITITAIDGIVQKMDKKTTIRILDVGCGDGEMLRKIADFYKNKNIKLSLVGVDLNPVSIEKAKTSSTAYPEIKFLAENVYNLAVPEHSYDILITTLTLHHFEDDEIIKVLQKFQNLSCKYIIINDLHRNGLAHLLFKLFSVFFIKGSVAKNDGLVSIRRGFKKKELQNYVQSLGWKAIISWKWAFRYLIVINLKDKKK